MSYVIISDSTCSLSNEEINECGVKVIYLSFIMDGKVYYSDSLKDIKLFYEKLRKKENASTSCINAQMFYELFVEELEKGNDILYVSFSSALSSTYANCVAAKEEALKKYPERKIICIDSLITSYGLGMLIYNAGLLQKQNKTIDEVAEYLEYNKNKATALFTVDDLFFLYRGGRVKPTSYLLAKAINIKPLLHVNECGKLVPFGRTFGRKKSLVSLVDKMCETIEDPLNQEVYISHGDCLDDVEYVINLINKKIKVKAIKVSYIDPVIGVHSGPGTLALFYFAKKRA